jgi:hypothetical protein
MSMLENPFSTYFSKKLQRALMETEAQKYAADRSAEAHVATANITAGTAREELSSKKMFARLLGGLLGAQEKGDLSQIFGKALPRGPGDPLMVEAPPGNLEELDEDTFKRSMAQLEDQPAGEPGLFRRMFGGKPGTREAVPQRWPQVSDLATKKKDKPGFQYGPSLGHDIVNLMRSWFGGGSIESTPAVGSKSSTINMQEFTPSGGVRKYKEDEDLWENVPWSGR